MHQKIKQPLIAGQFYPANASVLKNEIVSYLKKVKCKEKFINLFGIIAPHAGITFSGQTAAYGYKYIEDSQYDTIVVVAPSHVYIDHPICTYDCEAYRTPLGDIPLNNEIIELLLQNEKVGYNKTELRPENSLEVQLPFLQIVLTDFKLVPILIRDQSLQTAESLTDILYSIDIKLQDKNKIFYVFSSDLSHFHNDTNARRLDQIAIDSIEEMDATKFDKEIAAGNTEACGFGAIETGILLAKKKGYPKAKVVDYTHSGMIIGDNNNVVGYLSAIFYK